MTQEIRQSSWTFQSPERILDIFGPHNRYFPLFEESLGIEINLRGDTLFYKGISQAVELMSEIISQLDYLIDRGIHLNQMDLVNAIHMGKLNQLNEYICMYEKEILRDYEGKAIRAKNMGQQHYVQSIKKNDIVFGIGPAGTGKTFLAVAMAVSALKQGIVKRIILTRPAVEAGESLGFLPGDLKEKVDPYLRPLFDSLYAILGPEQTNRLMERETIEIAPLAYMRGRTLDNAFAILDEAQNTTTQQMKMFLTRLGYDSKMIINGDATQIDLPRGVRSGLIHASSTLESVNGIKTVRFSSSDVIRHPLVASIIDAYEENEKE